MSIPCAGVRIDVERVITVANLKLRIVYAANADEYSGLTTGKPMRRLSCILKGFPGHFQQEPLLGIHAACFPRSNTEEVRVKLIHMLQKASPARTHFSWCARIRV